MSFEKFAVAAWVYHRSTPKQRLRVIFSIFDSKHSGALDKADLASLLLVVTAAARQQMYRPGRSSIFWTLKKLPRRSSRLTSSFDVFLSSLLTYWIKA